MHTTTEGWTPWLARAEMDVGGWVGERRRAKAHPLRSRRPPHITRRRQKDAPRSVLWAARARAGLRPKLTGCGSQTYKGQHASLLERTRSEKKFVVRHSHTAATRAGSQSGGGAGTGRVKPCEADRVRRRGATSQCCATCLSLDCKQCKV